MLRIKEDSNCSPVEAREEIGFTFNGKDYKGQAGEPIAAALLANGVRILRHHEKSGRPRGIYCGIGHCYECRVTVNGVPGVRSCLTPLEKGMEVRSEIPEGEAPTGEN